MTKKKVKRNKFHVGRIVATPGVLAAVPTDELISAMKRHLAGDWGVVSAEDQAANDQAVKKGLRILSAYLSKDGTRFWIITEADRSATTFLLPDEY